MKDYIVRKANETDLEAISTIYEKIHDLEEKGKQTIGWIRNIYPTSQTAREAIKRKDMFVLEKRVKSLLQQLSINNKLMFIKRESGIIKFKINMYVFCIH